MITIKGEVKKEKLIELLRRAIADELDVGLFDFDIVDLTAVDTYERHVPKLTNFELEFTVKKRGTNE